jgi:uncharacterized SAM-binding protein YcdF (DUF218 family)
MSIFLSKLLPIFVYPLGISCLLIVLGIISRRWLRFQTIVLLLALLGLWLGGNRFIAYGLARTLEWQYIAPEELPQAEAIVVLGGGTDPIEYPRRTVEINSAGDRMFYAAQLYKEGKAPDILLSGGTITFQGVKESTPAEDMERVMEMLGIPKPAIWLESKSRNTYENAVFCQKILKEKGVRRIILVTSAMHMPRALGLFRHQGLDVIPAPADFTITQAGWEHLMEPSFETQIINLFPNASNLSLTTRVLKEYFGLLYYKVRGLV